MRKNDFFIVMVIVKLSLMHQKVDKKAKKMNLQVIEKLGMIDLEE